MRKYILTVLAAAFVIACSPNQNSGSNVPGGPSSETPQTETTTPPSVTTGDAEEIGNHDALIVSKYADAPIRGAGNRGVRYGLSPDNLDKETTLGRTTSRKGSFNVRLTALARATTYYYKAFITVWDADAGQDVDILGAVKQFTTTDTDEPDPQPDDPDPDNPDPDDPVDPETSFLQTDIATDISTSSAILHARYSGIDVSHAPQNVLFEWGTDSRNLSGKIAAGQTISNANGNYTATLSELSSGITYFFRASMDVWDSQNSKYQSISGDILSFTTRTADSGSQQTAPGWAELPALNYTHHGGNYNYYTDNTREEIYYVHHKAKDPHGNVVRNYTACWSGEHRCPVWIAAPRHKDYETGSAPSRNYRLDPDLPSNVQYKAASGSNSPYNRGHMLGAAERKGSKDMFSQVNYMTNIAPQHGTYFNSGSKYWNSLEDQIDKYVCSDTLYVVIGTYFKDYTDAKGIHASPKTITYNGSTDVSSPTMFYYALLRTKSGSSGKKVQNCSASELQCVAFVRTHMQSAPSSTNVYTVTATDMMSVADLERITGFTYFSNVPNAPKSTYKASDWPL